MACQKHMRCGCTDVIRTQNVFCSVLKYLTNDNTNTEYTDGRPLNVPSPDYKKRASLPTGYKYTNAVHLHTYKYVYTVYAHIAHIPMHSIKVYDYLVYD